MRPKTKLFAVKFRRILNVLCLQVYRKGSGHNFTICASRNEAICPEIQTHFGSSPLASLTEKVLGAITQFVRPKMKLFAVKFRRIFKSLLCCFPEICQMIFLEGSSVHILCTQLYYICFEF